MHISDEEIKKGWVTVYDDDNEDIIDKTGAVEEYNKEMWKCRRQMEKARAIKAAYIGFNVVAVCAFVFSQLEFFMMKSVLTGIVFPISIVLFVFFCFEKRQAFAGDGGSGTACGC